jgi:hypothetical protein
MMVNRYAWRQKTKRERAIGGKIEMRATQDDKKEDYQHCAKRLSGPSILEYRDKHFQQASPKQYRIHMNRFTTFGSSVGLSSVRIMLIPDITIISN